MARSNDQNQMSLVEWNKFEGLGNRQERVQTLEWLLGNLVIIENLTEYAVTFTLGATRVQFIVKLPKEFPLDPTLLHAVPFIRDPWINRLTNAAPLNMFQLTSDKRFRKVLQRIMKDFKNASLRKQTLKQLSQEQLIIKTIVPDFKGISPEAVNFLLNDRNNILNFPQVMEKVLLGNQIEILQIIEKMESIALRRNLNLTGIRALKEKVLASVLAECENNGTDIYTFCLMYEKFAADVQRLYNESESRALLEKLDKEEKEKLNIESQKKKEVKALSSEKCVVNIPEIIGDRKMAVLKENESDSSDYGFKNNTNHCDEKKRTQNELHRAKCSKAQKAFGTTKKATGFLKFKNQFLPLLPPHKSDSSEDNEREDSDDDEEEEKIHEEKIEGDGYGPETQDKERDENGEENENNDNEEDRDKNEHNHGDEVSDKDKDKNEDNEHNDGDEVRDKDGDKNEDEAEEIDAVKGENRNKDGNKNEDEQVVDADNKDDQQKDDIINNDESDEEFYMLDDSTDIDSDDDDDEYEDYGDAYDDDDDADDEHVSESETDEAEPDLI